MSSLTPPTKVINHPYDIKTCCGNGYLRLRTFPSTQKKVRYSEIPLLAIEVLPESIVIRDKNFIRQPGLI